MTERTYKKVKDNVYTAEKNFVKKAKEFFIAVAVLEDGSEGIVAQIDLGRFPPVEKPLMGASKQDRDAIIEAAKKMVNQVGVKIRVLRYTQCEIIEEFIPNHLN